MRVGAFTIYPTDAIYDIRFLYGVNPPSYEYGALRSECFQVSICYLFDVCQAFQLTLQSFLDLV